MNIPKAYISGFLKAAKLPRMLFILYIANLFTALMLALPFMGAFKNGFGNSAMISDLAKDFNFTALSNLLYYHGDGIQAILGGIKWVVLAYFLLSIFLTGGIIGTFNKDKYTNSNFFGSGAYNFFRFLGLNLITILFQLIFLLAVYIPLSSILEAKSVTADSQNTLYYYAIGAFLLHGIIFMIISIVNDYAKFYLVLNNSFNVFKGYWKGVKYVFGHFSKTLFLYVMLLFIPAVIMYVYLYFERGLKMNTGIGILIVFLIQQGFILLRCFLRAWVLSSQYQMYAHDFVITDPVQGVIFKVFDQSQTKEIKKEETVNKTETKDQNPPSNYAIDFNSTFSPNNPVVEDDHTGTVLSEEEMLKKFAEADNSDLGSTTENNSINTVTDSPSINLEGEGLDESETEIKSETVNSNITDENTNSESEIETESPTIEEEAVAESPSIDEEAVTESPSIDEEAVSEEIPEDEIINETVNTNVLSTDSEQVDNSDENTNSEISDITDDSNIEDETSTQDDESDENSGIETVNSNVVDNTEDSNIVSNESSIDMEAETNDINDESVNETVNTNVTGNDISEESEITNEELDESDIARKMQEKLEQENQNNNEKPVNEKITTKNEDKKYNAGETVEFSDEDAIEKQMAEKLSSNENPEQLSDNDIEQKMMDKHGNQHSANTPITYVHKKEEVVIEVNLVAEALVREHHLQGVSVVADDIDGEAVLDDVDIDSEVETDIMLEDYADNDDRDNHSFEVVQQNVMNLEKLNNDVVEFKQEKKKNDDIVEFEL